MLCNQHVTKMTVETTQMLATVLIRHGVSDDVLRRFGVVTKAGHPYQRSHLSHPCVMWAMSSRKAFDWLLTHGLALATEYAYRFKKTHACLGPMLGCGLIAEAGLTEKPLKHGPMPPFAQAMPDQFKDPSNAVRAYRRYYAHKMVEWTEKGRPPFYPIAPPHKPYPFKGPVVDPNRLVVANRRPSVQANVPLWLPAWSVRAHANERVVVAKCDHAIVAAMKRDGGLKPHA